MHRRAWLSFALASALVDANAAAANLPVPASLKDEARAAQARHRALVLMFSVAGCPWCRLVRESYLAPLRAEGQPVFELDLAGEGMLRGFDGAAASGKQLARAMDITLAPTVLFLGARGQELAQRLRGVPSTDFYDAYLQDRIDRANAAAARG